MAEDFLFQILRPWPMTFIEPTEIVEIFGRGVQWAVMPKNLPAATLPRRWKWPWWWIGT